MTQSQPICCTAFEGPRRIASGDLAQVAVQAKRVIDRGPREPVLIFDDATSQVIDLDFRGAVEDVVSRIQEAANLRVSNGDADCGAESSAPGSAATKRPGRPKLGVVGREVTLLPRHWDWLNSQPGGASVAMRKLVEEARRVNQGKDRIRQAQEAAYRFISVMAGNEPGFEEASRALFAGNKARFDQVADSWPIDLRDHARKLADPAFAASSPAAN
jgi:hypothetical protein